MLYPLTDEQRAVIDIAREIGEKKIKPVRMESEVKFVIVERSISGFLKVRTSHRLCQGKTELLTVSVKPVHAQARKEAVFSND